MPPSRRRRDLYRLAAGAALVMVLLALLQMTIEVIGVGMLGITVPTTVREWFQLMHENRLLALTEFTALQIPLFALLPVVLMALRAALGRLAPALADVAAVVGLVGVAVYLANNTALAMLSLADRYALASGDQERAALIAAGEAMLGNYSGPGLNAGVPLMMVSSLIFAVLMGRSPQFGRLIGSAGILVIGILLAYYIPLGLGESRIFLLIAGGGLYVVWIGWVGWRLRNLTAASGVQGVKRSSATGT